MWKIMLQLQTHCYFVKKKLSSVAEVAVHFIIQIKSHELFLSSAFLLSLMVTHTSSDRFFPANILCQSVFFIFYPMHDSDFLSHRSGPCSPIETLLLHREKCCCWHLISSQVLGLELLAQFRNWEGFL